MTILEAKRARLKEALDLADALKPFADPNNGMRVQFNRAWDAARKEAEAAAKAFADEWAVTGEKS